MKMIHRGESGLTLIELLIVIAILGIIAAVIIPNIAGFITSGNVAAANTEVENVKTAALGYYATFNQWPLTSDQLLGDNPTNTTFLSGDLKAIYEFDEEFGWILQGTTNSTAGGWSGIVFCCSRNGTSGWSGRWFAGTDCDDVTCP